MGKLAFLTRDLPGFPDQQRWEVVPLEKVYSNDSLKCHSGHYGERMCRFVRRVVKGSRWVVMAYAFSWTNTEDYQILSLCDNWDARTIGADADYVLSMGYSGTFGAKLARMRGRRRCFEKNARLCPWFGRLPTHQHNLATTQDNASAVYQVNVAKPLLSRPEFDWVERARIHQRDKGRTFMNTLWYNALKQFPGAPPP